MGEPEHISTDELIALTRGMQYDTATLLQDVARRMPGQRAIYLRNVAAALRRCADDMATYADTSTNPSPGG